MAQRYHIIPGSLNLFVINLFSFHPWAEALIWFLVPFLPVVLSIGLAFLSVAAYLVGYSLWSQVPAMWTVTNTLWRLHIGLFLWIGNAMAAAATRPVNSRISVIYTFPRLFHGSKKVLIFGLILDCYVLYFCFNSEHVINQEDCLSASV